MIHTGEERKKPYSCENCKKKFGKPSDLKKHMSIHTGEKPFQCKTCGICYPHSTSLRCHEITAHTKNYPFNCKLCPYKCLDNLKLKEHNYIHTGEKPYSCEHCSKSFNKVVNLRAHIQAVHFGIKRAPKTQTNSKEGQITGSCKK